MTVFANNLEISSKKQGCKVIAAFPDTCFTPPLTPATPPGVPVPYPDFGMDSDLTSGTGTVKIGGETVSQENSSKYSKCSGDEAGSAPKKGIITSKNMGAVYAQKWSMDVKFEGKGVVRFSDIATSNHACNPGDSPPMVIVGKPGMPGFMAHNANCCVGTYEATEAECSKRGGQRHHIIPDEYLRESTRGTPPVNESLPTLAQGCCVCVGGYSSATTSREATQTDNVKATVDSADKYAAGSGADSLADMRDHGLMHLFDSKFRAGEPTVERALDIANDLLDECVKSEHSCIDGACAEQAKQCLETQFAKAKNEEINLNKKKRPSEDATNRKRQKLGMI